MVLQNSRKKIAKFLKGIGKSFTVLQSEASFFRYE